MPHITTGRTPAEVLLKWLPRTRLSLIHPCVEHRMQTAAEKGIGEHKPRKFNVGQSVALRDFWPNATTKWRQATITKQTGPLTYEVNLNDQTRQAHVDHIRPWPVVDHTSAPELDSPSTILITQMNHLLAWLYHFYFLQMELLTKIQNTLVKIHTVLAILILNDLADHLNG